MPCSEIVQGGLRLGGKPAAPSGLLSHIPGCFREGHPTQRRLCLAKRTFRDAEKPVEEAGEIVRRQVRKGPDLIADPDTEDRATHDVFHGRLAMMARRAQPRFRDRHGQDRVPPDARPFGDLHQSILGQFLEKSPALGMTCPAIERATAHPESLERVPDAAAVALRRPAEPPVHDVGRHNCSDEGPDIIPKCFATSEELGLCKPGSSLGVEAGVGLPPPLPPEAMFLRDVDELLPQGGKGRRGDWRSAGCGVTNLIGKFARSEPDPA